MVKRLEVNVISLMEKEAIPLLETDNADISTITSELNSLVAEKFAPESPQRVFWDQQRQPERQAADEMAPSSDQICTKFEIHVLLCLQCCCTWWGDQPSFRSDYTHWTSPHTGVQLEFIEKL